MSPPIDLKTKRRLIHSKKARFFNPREPPFIPRSKDENADRAPTGAPSLSQSNKK